MIRGAKLALWALGAILAAVALGIAYRAPLLETLLRGALAARGIPDARLTVENLGWRGATIVDLSLGAAEELRAERVSIVYDLSAPGDLFAGRIQPITLDGLVLALDLTGDRPPLGSLQDLAAGAEPEDGTDIPAIPPVVLKDARIEALTPFGPVEVRLAATLQPGTGGAIALSANYALAGEVGRLSGRVEAARGPDGRTETSFILDRGTLAMPGAELRGLRGRGTLRLEGNTPKTASLELTLGEIALPGAAFEQAHLNLRMDGPRLDLDATLATADGRFTASARAGLGDFLGQPNGELELEVSADAQAVIWPLLALPAPAKGRIEAAVSARGRLPPLADLLDGETGVLAHLRPADFTGRSSLRLHDIDYPGHVQGLSGDVVLDFGPTSISPDSPRHLTGAVNVALTASRVTHGELQATAAILEQALRIDTADEKIGIRLSKEGVISARQFRYSSILTSDGPISLQVTAGSVEIDLGTPEGLDLTHDITLAPAAIRAAVPRGGGAPTAVQARARQIRAVGSYRTVEGYAGRIEVADGGIAVPQFEVAAEEFEATIELARDGAAELRFAVGALRHTAEPSVLGPIGLRGAIKQSAGTAALSMTAAGLNDVGEVSVTGRHLVAAGKGEARITLAPLSFAPGAAQPGALFPAFAELRNVTGRARAEAALSWTPKTLSGTAELKIEDLSLESPAARVEGLSLDLALTQLLPPGSAPGQILRVRRIDPGVALDELSLRFRVVPGNPPAIAIADAGFSLAGGRISMTDVRIDPADRRHDVPLRVEALDLAEVFSLLGIDGVSGEGRLSGTIPLRILEGVPGFAKGRMTAQGPGLLRVRSDYAKRALSGAGESADLLLRALEDFHYQELSVTIDQPSAKLALVGLSMLGHNPDVLEGHPFRFNINLETDPTKLLTALQEAYRISNRAISQIWMFGR